MAELGKQNRLVVLKESPQGHYLDGGDDGEILLPGAQVPDWVKIGDTLSVFIYCDSEDRLIATTKEPFAKVGQFAYLEVISVNRDVGAFLDWGLDKDLLLPFREQADRVEVGEGVVAYVMVDPLNNRIVASSRLNRHLDLTEPQYEEGESVSLIVTDETPLGYKAIVENAHTGLLYKSELSEPLQYGQPINGFIKSVRPDGKIDLRRDMAGYKRVLSISEEIFDSLVEAGGSLPYNDKTPPETIRKAFGISKKAFKQALGSLYKQRRIRFAGDGIELTQEPLR